MSVYAVALITIHDRDGYGTYERGFMDIFNRYAGRLVAADEAPEVLEGQWPWTRTVVIEFPDHTSLEAWYHSADYQALAQHRFRAADAAIAVVKGLEAAAD